MSKIAVIVVIFIFAALASAQIPPSGNVFFGYSYYNTDITGGRNHRNGWEGSVEGRFLPSILGGGLDYKLVRLLAWRSRQTTFTAIYSMCPKNNVRVLTGIVLRF